MGGGWRPPAFAEPFLAVWLCGYVALWLCGYVAMWLRAYVAMWLCGQMDMWLCGYVAILNFVRVARSVDTY